MHSNEQMKSSLVAAEQYAQAITPQTLDYLAGRGISDEVAARFQLGTVTDPVAGHEHHVGWLSIPYITALDLCVGFKFRRLDEGKLSMVHLLVRSHTYITLLISVSCHQEL